MQTPPWKAKTNVVGVNDVVDVIVVDIVDDNDDNGVADITCIVSPFLQLSQDGEMSGCRHVASCRPTPLLLCDVMQQRGVANIGQSLTCNTFTDTRGGM